MLKGQHSKRESGWAIAACAVCVVLTPIALWLLWKYGWALLTLFS